MFEFIRWFIMYDYHTHSHFSNDCQSKLESMVEAAVSKGIKEIAVTDHIDLDYAGTDIYFDFDVSHQQACIAEVQKKVGHVIKIRKGIEMGIQRHVLDDCSKLVDKYKPDFVIASMHMAERKDFYNGDFTQGKTAEEALRIFFEELDVMTTTYKAYSVVGHFDILKRYDERVLKMHPSFIKDLAEGPLKKVISHGKGIEVNSSGLRQGLNETLPSNQLLELYYELGGRIITFGSDAHSPSEVGHSYDKVINQLRMIGFKEIFTFENMQPLAVKI